MSTIIKLCSLALLVNASQAQAQAAYPKQLKGFDAQQWHGVVGPAGMPPAIVKQLNETLNQVLKSPELKEKLSIEAVEPQTMSPEQFGAFIKADVARWTKLAKAKNIELDN